MQWHLNKSEIRHLISACQHLINNIIQLYLSTEGWRSVERIHLSSKCFQFDYRTRIRREMLLLLFLEYLVLFSLPKLKCHDLIDLTAIRFYLMRIPPVAN